MSGETAVILVAIGLLLTMVVGMASQRRRPRLEATTPPSPTKIMKGPTAEQQEDIEAVQESIEAARTELRWLRDQVARERERLERMRKQHQPATQATPQPQMADSPWVVLGLRPGSGPDDIRRRYRLLSRVWHPDRFIEGPPELRAEAELMMARLNKAHNALVGATAGFRR
ncbi:MAG TPA: J domain-containing protein [Chloroflexota bacterium]|nr:J domain-containing protein [Chloroflexota bacterium]